VILRLRVQFSCLARFLRQLNLNHGFRVVDKWLHNLNQRFQRLALGGFRMIWALHIVHRSLVQLLLIMLRAQSDRHQVLQNKPVAGLDLHGSRGLHPVNLVKRQKGDLVVWSLLCAVVIFPWRKHGKTGGGLTLLRGCLMCYLKFAEFFWSFS